MRNPTASRLGLALTLIAATASADDLIKNGSFEEPKIEGQVTSQKGGVPLREGLETTWTHLQSMDRTGKVIVGMTSQIARTGRQSVFVKFEGAEKTRGAFLMTDLIPIKAEEKYRISIWGRVDSKEPLTLDQGRPFQILEVEFYPADQESRIGETMMRTQMIPGMAGRLLFLSTRWSEYYAEVSAPAEAQFMKVTFRWESPKYDGPATGMIYFDDASVTVVPGAPVSPTDATSVDPATAAPQASGLK